MDLSNLTNIAYIVAAVFFILGIKRLGKVKTARSGNQLAAIGMFIAVVAVFFENDMTAHLGTALGPNNPYIIALACVIVGSLIGIVWAKKVAMTGMPEMVALLNGFGGLASFLVAYLEFSRASAKGFVGLDAFTAVSTGLAILIGAVTFTGSVIAWGKLSEKIKGSFNGNIINALLLFLALDAIVLYALPFLDPALKVQIILALSVISFLFGITLVMPIGGGDMPVVISLLNSLSGIAVAMAGFIIANTVLIVTGCLVGASGLILTLLMCKAMNRSISNLLFKKFGASGKAGAVDNRESKSISAEDAFAVLEAAQSVVFIPGYGMAVAQAQHAVKELMVKLEGNGAEVNFAIHPVAGRMPGHMNVLLAEADIPYEQLKTMEEINAIISTVDVAIVIGANDVVNPAAEEDSSSPIYGMPIIKAHEAKTCFILKRGKGKGFSGIENELFFRENSVMVYGDAKATISALAAEFAQP